MTTGSKGTKRKAAPEQKSAFTGNEEKILGEFAKSKLKKAKLETNQGERNAGKQPKSMFKVKKARDVPDEVEAKPDKINGKGKTVKQQKKFKVKKDEARDLLEVQPKNPNHVKIPKRKVPFSSASKKKKEEERKMKEKGQKPEDVAWKDFKKGQRDLKLKRKQGAEPSRYQMSVKAKEVWEELRREDTPEKRKVELCSHLYNLLKGNFKQLIFAHDTVRVVECIVATAASAVRDAIFGELKRDLLLIAKSKYAHFYILKVLRYGTKEQRRHIIQTFMGQVTGILRHKIASKVLETAYNDWANALERAQICQEFYGPEFKLFKDEGINTLNDALAKYSDKKETFLNHMKEALEPIIEKGVFQHSVIHRLIHEYLSICPEKDREELIQSLREACVEMVHTRDGARVAMLCLWHGTNKDRKAIAKSFKTHVTKICMEEHGYMALLALFDCVDDTVFVSKAILPEIASNLKDIAFHEHGRKVILYLLAGRDTKYTHPQVIEILKQGDANPNSKKDMAVRHKELREAISPALLDSVVEDTQDWFDSNSSLLVLLDALQHCEGDLKPAFEVVAKLACSLETTEEKGKKMLRVEQTAIHMVLKKLIQFDKVRHEKGQTDLFCALLLEELTTDVVSAWIETNRGAFTFIIMLETEVGSIVEALKKKLSNFKKHIQNQATKGCSILLAKLNK